MTGGLSQTRSKADFRMLREMLGLPQAWVARQLGVTPLTVKNWENPKEFYPPRREAWDLIESLWSQADMKAASLVEIAVEAARMAKDRGVEPTPIMLTYWKDVKDYKQGVSIGCNNENSYRIANAATRMAADRLRVLGLPVTVMYAETEA